MAWVESHQSLSRHRKTIRASTRLGVDRFKLIGHLHQLWWWALDNTDADGRLGDMSSFEIAAAAEWDGNANDFVEALIEAGFIDQKPDGLYLHDWYDYAGKYMEAKQKERERWRARRNAGKLSTGKERSGGAPAELRRSTAETPLAPNLTLPNQEEIHSSSSLRSEEECRPDGRPAFGDSPSEPETLGEQPVPQAHEQLETNSSPPPRLTIRAAMAPVLEYLLEKTRRPRESVTQAEADATYYLDERHTPLAVKSQINQLVKRFQKSGRPLSELTLDYVWESMRYWLPTRPGGRAPMPRDPPRDPLLDKLREDGDSA